LQEIIKRGSWISIKRIVGYKLPDSNPIQVSPPPLADSVKVPSLLPDASQLPFGVNPIDVTNPGSDDSYKPTGGHIPQFDGTSKDPAQSDVHPD
jgi:hypothetical protein